ncbi:KpsF/GutQ family sugar-phosphate isomerase [Granulicella sp. WH15]|uniref:KpsF/GutQ family sugar-phosphate isomerase n=1 Tax=Granulicella sp. WH15 TaxID=2602070 RepID=UPI001367174E|nr:KpsF/GutQ family sugar-phosphate isomerase [Granulicella sp. WH15]QHN04591.1 KpsF/GutQ family sugar-phosphate isomerase [Granulicella sp. WH15]
MPTQTHTPATFVRIEAAALSQLADRLDTTLAAPFERAVALLLAASAAEHRIIVTGIGKSGLIGLKLAATLSSTGSPAQFLHAAEAVHGDMGILQPGDIVLALSYSGETEELLRLLPTLNHLAIPIVSLCGAADSTLARASAVTLDTSVDQEACPLNLAPTASTTLMLALGDALALELSQRRGFAPQHFATLHPGGLLGRRLERVRDVMHTGDAIPRVARQTAMPEVIHEMSRKHLGMTAVLDGDRLEGIISDGDLRRLLEREGTHALEKTAGEIMNPTPVTISPEAFGSDALALMEERKITTLIVVADGRVEGALHLHDLWQGA